MRGIFRDMPSFQDIPHFPTAHYQVDVDWNFLERHIRNAIDNDGLILEPDFQRAHVWTQAQQIAYVEIGPYEILDGKQRLEAVRAFLRGDLPIFGHRFSEYTGHLRVFHSFKWKICTLETREEVLQLYLNINAGGTPHTQAELDRVWAMLKAVRCVG